MLMLTGRWLNRRPGFATVCDVVLPAERDGVARRHQLAGSSAVVNRFDGGRLQSPADELHRVGGSPNRQTHRPVVTSTVPGRLSCVQRRLLDCVCRPR